MATSYFKMASFFHNVFMIFWIFLGNVFIFCEIMKTNLLYDIIWCSFQIWTLCAWIRVWCLYPQVKYFIHYPLHYKACKASSNETFMMSEWYNTQKPSKSKSTQTMRENANYMLNTTNYTYQQWNENFKWKKLCTKYAEVKINSQINPTILSMWWPPKWGLHPYIYRRKKNA